MMRKILVLSLIVCVLLTAVSCQTEEPSNQEPDCVEYPVFDLEHYEEYAFFMNTMELPDTFISYEALKAIGRFDDWILESIFLSNDYRYYQYKLIDANNYKIRFAIHHGSNGTWKWDLLDMPEAMTDLRFYPKAVNGEMMVGNIGYVYFKGELSSIRWSYKDIAFELDLDDPYPTDGEETFLSKMLSLETAEETLASLLSDIAACCQAQASVQKMFISSYEQLLELQALNDQSVISQKDAAEFFTALNKVEIPDLGRFADLIDVTYNRDEQYIRFIYKNGSYCAFLRFTVYLPEASSAVTPAAEGYTPWKTISFGEQEIDLYAHMTDLEGYKRITSAYGFFSTEYGEVLINIDANGIDEFLKNVSEYLQFVPFSELSAREVNVMLYFESYGELQTWYIERHEQELLQIPYYQGKPMELRDWDGYSYINFFEEELYGQPWIRYPCIVDGENAVIQLSDFSIKAYCEENDPTYSAFLKEFAPDAPNLHNIHSFPDYQTVREQSLTLQDKEVVALYYEYKDDPRVSYHFIYNEMLVIVTAEPALLGSDFWKNFSLQAYSNGNLAGWLLPTIAVVLMAVGLGAFFFTRQAKRTKKQS